MGNKSSSNRPPLEDGVSLVASQSQCSTAGRRDDGSASPNISESSSLVSDNASGICRGNDQTEQQCTSNTIVPAENVARQPSVKLCKHQIAQSATVAPVNTRLRRRIRMRKTLTPKSPPPVAVAAAATGAASPTSSAARETNVTTESRAMTIRNDDEFGRHGDEMWGPLNDHFSTELESLRKLRSRVRASLIEHDLTDLHRESWQLPSVTSLIVDRAECIRQRNQADKTVQIISNATQPGEREAFLAESRRAENQLRQCSDEVSADKLSKIVELEHQIDVDICEASLESFRLRSLTRHCPYDRQSSPL